MSERCVAYRQLSKEVSGDDRVAEMHAHVQQQGALGTPRFQREIEATIGRCTGIRAAPIRGGTKTLPVQALARFDRFDCD